MRKILFATVALVGLSGPVLASGAVATSGGSTSSSIESGKFGFAAGSTSGVSSQSAYASTCSYCGTATTRSYNKTTATGVTSNGYVGSTSSGGATAKTYSGWR